MAEPERINPAFRRLRTQVAAGVITATLVAGAAGIFGGHQLHQRFAGNRVAAIPENVMLASGMRSMAIDYFSDGNLTFVEKNRLHGALHIFAGNNTWYNFQGSSLPETRMMRDNYYDVREVLRTGPVDSTDLRTIIRFTDQYQQTVTSPQYEAFIAPRPFDQWLKGHAIRFISS